MPRTKGIIIVLLFFVLCIGTGYCSTQAEQKPDPYAKSSILVEAFVVKVSVAALAEAGVSAIGQSPDGVSILKILWCLSGDEGEVVSGAKLMLGNRDEAQSEREETVYVKTERVTTRNTKDGPIQTKEDRHDDYRVGNIFEARSYGIDSDGKSIRLNYRYSETGMDIDDKSSKPLRKFSYTWDGNLFVHPGKPTIAGAMQSDDEATFFIITATIQNAKDAKTK